MLLLYNMIQLYILQLKMLFLIKGYKFSVFWQNHISSIFKVNYY